MSEQAPTKSDWTKYREHMTSAESYLHILEDAISDLQKSSPELVDDDKVCCGEPVPRNIAMRTLAVADRLKAVSKAFRRLAFNYIGG